MTKLYAGVTDMTKVCLAKEETKGKNTFFGVCVCVCVCLKFKKEIMKVNNCGDRKEVVDSKDEARSTIFCK